MATQQYLPIGIVAKRSGVNASALRFYETRGLIQSLRNSSNQRQYHRSTLRIISIIRIAQTLGLGLDEISDALKQLPDNRSPTKKDWQKLSRKWQKQLDDRISKLQELRDTLDGCIGCGCLSLKNCALYNPNDIAAQRGDGPRHLLE